MNSISQFLKPWSLVFGLLGAASVLCLIKFVLRLLAADELNPVARVMVRLGGYLTGPFETLTSLKPVGQLPGSTFEPSALVGSLGYLVLALAIALALGSWRGLAARNIRQNNR
ncbi:MAG: hypothetical protein JWP00_2941 [Chloroflexi bacterium]|nr:hypothetical protein [Chloroflexota bacterium]